MIRLTYEMTFTERIEGPLGPTCGSPPRMCWTIAEATLRGPRIDAQLATPGTDWIRVEQCGTRRQDQRSQFLDEDNVLILMRYDTGLLRHDISFAKALEQGVPTRYGDHYIYMVPQFEVGDVRYAWLTESLFIGEGRLCGSKRIQYQIFKVHQ